MRRYAPSVQLYTLYKEERPVTRIRLMKLLFLIREETDVHQHFSFYDFLPYKYGPYSFYADSDLHDLREKNYLKTKKESKNEVRREKIPPVLNKLPEIAKSQIKSIVQQHKHRDDQDLIDYVYEQYPAFTILSKREESDRARPGNKPNIYTIGYEGKTIDQFLHSLIQNGIERIIDVRKNPLSRKFGFSRGPLEKYCQKIDVGYLHVPDLGIPSEKRTSLDDPESYEALFDEYENNILEGKKGEIDRVAEYLKENPSALLCFEADPSFCHRSRLAEQVKASTTLEIQHIEI